MRLIDADALRESVLKWLPHDPCGVEENEYPYETDICVSMLMEIEDAPTIEPQPHWIPCSERLPREEEQDDELGVLVTLGNGYSGLQYDLYHDDHWYDWDGFVVAWMPLPPMYQEKGK